MTVLHVEGMSCAHCERAVTQAIHGVDPDAHVTVDLATGTVDTDSRADTALLANAIRAEGYAVTR